jgi:hypothetical protein
VSQALALVRPVQRIGAEYRGLARRFRDEVRAADAQLETTLSAVTPPLHRRLRHHVRLRHEQAQSAVVLYRRLAPAAFRIGEVTMLPDRDCFEISETRLTATWLHASDWAAGNEEQGVALARFWMRLEGGRLRTGWMPSALISAHALARHFERTGNRDHALLVRDLAMLRDVPEDLNAGPTADGYWLGDVDAMRGPEGRSRIRNVRTFVVEDLRQVQSA